MDKRHVEDWESIIEIDGELCGQVIYILIDPGYNYMYVSLDLMDMYGLSKELHAKSWLVKFGTCTMK